MKDQLLYKDFAKYYDLLYSFKDSEKETKRIITLIQEFKKSAGNDLLEVGCGTGKYLEQLEGRFNCTGVDINEGMLSVARKKLKHSDLKQADMINLELNKQFDVIICLFSSIGYVKTDENLQKTLVGFAKHLKPGGVIIIEPWITEKFFKAGIPNMTTYDGKDIKIARLNVTTVEGNISIMDMHYLVAEKDKGVIYFSDRHELGMFETDRVLELMSELGLEAKFIEDGLMPDRGLFIGIKS